MIKIAICDDDKIFLETAKLILSETSQKLKNEIWIDTYLNGNDVINRLLNKKEPLDILILDIDMPKITGLELAEKLRAGGEQLIIIFLSAHEKFVFKAIEYIPFRYIRKNQMKTELPLALQAAFTTVNANADKEITVKTDGDERRIFLSQIMYYEVFQRKIVIYLKNGAEIITKKTIKEMQELIPDDRFITLHRNCVVNASYVKNIGDCTVTLDDGQKLIISRTRLKEVKSNLLKFWGDLI